MKTLAILIPLIFTSCGFQNFKGVKANNLNERVFENSLDDRVKRGTKVEAEFKGVYMSDISKEFSGYEVFLISLYFFDDKIEGLQDVDFRLTLNGVQPIKIDEISRDSSIVPQIKLLNPWFKNYVVYFKKLDSTDMRLEFQYNRSQNLVMNMKKGQGERRDYPSIAKKLFTIPN